MKKLLIAVLASVMVLTGFTANAVNSEEKSSISLENPERLNKIIITLLMPEIQKAVNDFYEPYLSIEPTVVAYFGDSKITNIIGDTESSIYTVEVEVEPYVGPHISIGRDRMTFEIRAGGTATIKNYEHLKNYDLPQNRQHLIKKPLP